MNRESSMVEVSMEYMQCINHACTYIRTYSTSRYKVNDERRSFVRSFVRLFQSVHFVRSFVRLSHECDTVFFVPSPITYVVRQERDGVFKLRATTDPVSSPPQQILPRYCEDFSR